MLNFGGIDTLAFQGLVTFQGVWENLEKFFKKCMIVVWFSTKYNRVGYENKKVARNVQKSDLVIGTGI